MSEKSDSRILDRTEFEEAVDYTWAREQEYRQKLLAHDEALRQKLERHQAFREHLLRRLEQAKATISGLASRMVKEMDVASKLIDAAQEALLSSDAIRHPEMEVEDPRGYWISREAYRSLDEALRNSQEDEDDES